MHVSVYLVIIIGLVLAFIVCSSLYLAVDSRRHSNRSRHHNNVLAGQLSELQRAYDSCRHKLQENQQDAIRIKAARTATDRAHAECIKSKVRLELALVKSGVSEAAVKELAKVA